MEDGPEAADGVYVYGSKAYRLEERESEVWTVLDGELVIGIVKALPVVDDRGVLYVVEVPAETEAEDVPTPEWRDAVEYVIGQAE